MYLMLLAQMIFFVRVTKMEKDIDLENVDYCRLCKIKGSHTVCRFPSAGGRDGCALSPLSADEKLRLLRAHNALRSRVALGAQRAQPPAANMQRLRWDLELEAVAGRWAEQCVDEHDACRASPRFAVGQNLAWRSRWDLERLVRLWFEEVNLFNASAVGSYAFEPATGHYTQTSSVAERPRSLRSLRMQVTDSSQLSHRRTVWKDTPFTSSPRTNLVEAGSPRPPMRAWASGVLSLRQLVWAQTRLVGCARADRGPARLLRFSLVCNYGPAGNVLRRPVYLRGRPRSACPPRTRPDQEYLGLCASPIADFTPMRLHPSLRAPPAPRPPQPPGAPAKTAPGGGHKQKQERTQKTRKFAKEKAPKQQRVLVTTSKYDVSTSSGAAIGEKMATYDIQSLTVLVLEMLSAYLISSFELRF